MKRALQVFLVCMTLALAATPARSEPDFPPWCERLVSCRVEDGCDPNAYLLHGYQPPKGYAGGCSAAIVEGGNVHFANFLEWIPLPDGRWMLPFCRELGPCTVCNLNPRRTDQPAQISCPEGVKVDELYLSYAPRAVIKMQVFLPLIN